ncbi:MAG: Wzz/FepE/Etk N-terminal domain-containing protein [Cyclobacteriaceae bacterium]
MTEENKNINSDREEIDLVELVGYLWEKKHFILKVAGVFLIIGLIVAFTSKVEYQASCRLMPENMDGMRSNLGGLSGLAGLAGIDLGQSRTGLLTPELYPEIVKSVPFQLVLLNQPVYYEKLDSTISSFSYFKEIDRPSLFRFILAYTIGMPGKIKEILSNQNTEEEILHSDIIRLSKDDSKLIERFKERVDVSIDKSTGIVSIFVKMPDAYASAKMADLVVLKLTERVTDYKIGKTRVNLEFIEERYKEVENEYKRRQRNLANFIDGNKNISSSLIQTEYQRLQNEMNISFEVYKSLATQLEQAKIKLKEETPVFTVLEPVKIPVEKSEPKRLFILTGFLFVGIFFSTLTLLIRKFIKLNVQK